MKQQPELTLEETVKEPQVTELAKVLTDSKLALNEAEEIKQSYLPYFEQMGIIKEEAKKINFESPTMLDEKIARDLRLRTVKIRTGSMAIKEERKRIHMLKANVEQSAWNLIKTTCELDEEIFLQVEKKREIEEKARLSARKEGRIKLLEPFGVDTQFIALLNMPDEAFEQFLSQTNDSYEKKIADEKRAQEEEIERQRVQEEKRLEMIAENKRLREEAEAKEAALAKEREEQEAKLNAIKEKAEQERRAAEAEASRIRIENEKKVAAEKARVEAEQEKMREEAQAKIDAERKERERIQAELLAKEQAELKAKEEAEAAKEFELAKGDTDKIQDLQKDLESLKLKYTFKSAKHKKTYAEVGILLDKILNHIIGNG